MKNLFFAMLFGAIALTSCKKEEVLPTTTTPTPTTTNVKLASATTTSGVQVDLYAKTATLNDGYNPLYVKVMASGGAVNASAVVSYNPMMDMGTMMHTTPTEQPVFNSATQMYEGVVSFVMPSSAGGAWTLNVTVDGELVSFPLTILSSPTKVIGIYTGTDAKNYVVSLVPLATWEVGMNDVEIMIHERASMMSFPAVSNFDIVMTPEMVSMGHGSPNNVSPTATANGHYKGKVNYTMTGDWRLHFKLNMGGVLIQDDAFLDILF
jgi:hypothetical protein